MAETNLKVILDPDTRKLDRALKGKRIGVSGGKKDQKEAIGVIGGLEAQIKNLGKQITEATDVEQIRQLQEEKAIAEKELEVTKGMKKDSGILTGLTKRVLVSIVSIAAILTALDFIIRPMAALLTAILTLLFLPLIPVMLPAFKVLAKWIPKLAEFSKKVSNIVQKIVDFFTGTVLGKFLLNPFKFMIDFLKKGAGILLNIGKFLIDNFIVPGFLFFVGIGEKLWNQIIMPGFDFLSDIGSKLWEEIIKPGFLFLEDVGQKAWDLMKGGFTFIKDTMTNAIRAAANAIIGLINRLPFVNVPHLAAGGVVTRPTLAVVGERGPEAVIPLNQARGFGGNVTINFNNPIVRQESDFRKIADQVSRVMAKQKLRGFAPSF